MAFDKDTGASAGKKSKRGSSKQINEIREVYSELLHNNKDKLQEWFEPITFLQFIMGYDKGLLPNYPKLFSYLSITHLKNIDSFGMFFKRYNGVCGGF